MAAFAFYFSATCFFFCKYLSNLFFLHSNNGTLQWREFIKCSIYAILNYDFFFREITAQKLTKGLSEENSDIAE